MVVSVANLHFCCTIMGWALPEITSTLPPHAQHFLVSCLCSPAAPLRLNALPSLPLSDTFRLWCCRDNKAGPKPRIYITKGVPMPRNTHDAQKKARERSLKWNIDGWLKLSLIRDILLMFTCSGKCIQHLFLRAHPQFHLSRRLLLPLGLNVKEPPPRFCPFIKLRSKSKFNGAQSPKRKTPTRPQQQPRAQTKHSQEASHGEEIPRAHAAPQQQQRKGLLDMSEGVGTKTAAHVSSLQWTTLQNATTILYRRMEH